jgi:hypothetical protein
MKKTLRVILVIFVVLFWLMNLWRNTTVIPIEESTDQTVQEICEEFIQDDSLEMADPGRIIQRSWASYHYTDNYCARYSAKHHILYESASFRESLQIPYDGQYVKFWGALYYELSQHASAQLSFLQDSLIQLARTKNLDRTDFASFVVSFVQDIPYEFVMHTPCTGNEQKPCNGNVLYGIFSPVEFLYQLKGDCDTRTVLLFTLLENLGYDAVIFISREYEHSMLGIDLPAVGDYITFNGTNYYFWETTNVGWMPGIIPPEMNNTKYWKVALN